MVDDLNDRFNSRPANTVQPAGAQYKSPLGNLDVKTMPNRINRFAAPSYINRPNQTMPAPIGKYPPPRPVGYTGEDSSNSSVYQPQPFANTGV